jgi:hypothetical protein
MNPAEVLTLELQQFEDQGLKTIVPVVYGGDLAAWMERNADEIDFGSGAKNGSMIMVVGGRVPCTIWTSGTLEIDFQY